MQNRFITTKFLKDLDSLNKSRNLSTKALKNESFCFRIKFGKHESPTISPSECEASGVKMYETHIPGFCFHRNGQYRTANMKSDTSENEIIMKLYPYIFTQGEIDPEKVVCMHLLTVQTVEMPNNLHTKKMINQAIFKSFAEEDQNYENIFPMYLLESEFYKVNILSKDGIREIKLINKRIELLINMIMHILEDTNNEKYLKIIELARNRTEIFKLIKHKKLREMFELCKTSSVLTDLRCYKAVNVSNFDICYTNIKKIRMPEKCIMLEKFIGQIRNRLLKEIQMVCRKSDKSQLILDMQNEINTINLRETDHNEGLIRKVEFLEKTQKSSNIRKESASIDEKINLFKLNNVNNVFQSMSQRTSINDKKLEKERLTFLLSKMNNSQRIRIGKKVAELKSKRTSLGLEEKRISLDGIIQEVLSKRSLENLFTCSSDEESQTICKSFENNQNEYVKGHSEIELNDKNLESDSLLSKNQKNNTSYIFTKIKQDVINKETDKKIERFLAK